MRCHFTVVLLLCGGSAVETLYAQIAGGNVSGVVIDPSGASIPRAKVVLRSLATQIVRTVNANVEGLYAMGQKSAATVDFPNRLTGPDCGSAVNPGNPSHYKTQCFAFSAPATLLGNSGRNILTGPGLVNADFSLVKSIPMRWVAERFRAQWRAELFNALNHPNFLPPLNNLKLFDAAGRPVAGAGLLDTTATPSRQIQFALKLLW
jgi:hypothetical protein